MPVVVSVIVGSVLAVWLAMFVWSTVRAARNARHRAPLRDASTAPEGLVLGIREPEAMRAPFAFVLRGQVLDVAQSFVGEFRGAEVGITDVTVKVRSDHAPTNHTVATLDVDWRWPWLRLRRVEVVAPDVEQPTIALDGVDGATSWVLEAADEELARQIVTAELLAWLRRGGFPLQLEMTPRHLLVAVDGQVPTERLADLLALTTGVVDHLSTEVKARVTPPRPEDDV